jgi:thiol:disulfide interchange protein
MRYTVLIATLLAAGSMAAGQGLDSGDEFVIGPVGKEAYLRAEAIASHTHVAAGQTFHVALVVEPRKDWYYYSPDPGSSGGFTPLAASVYVSGGVLTAGEVLWPVDRRHEYDLGGMKLVNYAYDGRAVLYVPMTVPADAPAGKHKLTLQPRGQVCGDQCVNLDGLNKVAAVAEVTVADSAAANPKWDGVKAGLAEAVTAAKLVGLHKASISAAEAAAPATAVGADLTVWTGLALALLAGLILNIMPCVLPVVPLRILSIVSLAKESRRRFVTLGLAFAGGIVVFFVALAAISAGVRLATGGALDWGKHFQLAPFRIGMSMLMVALAANMLGAFGVIVPGKIAALGAGAAGQPKREHLTSAGMGLMMAILATPCSFAILAAAFAWAQTQPLWLGSLAIGLIGVGMAAPHALLTAFPDLVKKLPRPGPWMEHLKQSMGFLLLLVAIWLIGTLSEDTYPAWVTAYGVVLAFALWVWGKWVRYDATVARKLAVRGSAVALAVAAGFWMLPAPSPGAVKLVEFNEARIAAARGGGQTVLVKFTASWCMSCKIVDLTIYNDKEVAERLAAGKVLAVKGDVTRSEMPANDMLYRRFRGAPPLTVILPPGKGRPIFLPGKFSQADLFAALDKAKGT